MGQQGTTTIDFGALPGKTEVALDVTGLTGFISTSACETWILPKVTADHSVDEHLIENLRVIAAYKTDGTMTIYGYVVPFPQDFRINANERDIEVQKHRLYGLFNVGWVWN